MGIFPTFSRPLALLLLALVPGLLWWWQWRGRAALRYSSIGLFAGLPGGRGRWARRGGWTLRGLGLSLLVVALAGPRWPNAGARLTTEGIALAMVVDVSGSMYNDDFAWNEQTMTRLEGVKKIFRLFVEGGTTPDGGTLPGRPQDLMALVSFASLPETSCPLTLDHAALLKILDGLQPRPFGEDRSNPGDALAWTLASLQKAPARRKVIVFLSDGESNVPGKLSPRQAAQLAGNLGIPIYAIDADPETSTDEEAVQARKTLQDVAAISQGRYFKASGAAALAEVYAAIDRLERSRLESYEYASYHEAFHWFSLASLTCWLGLVFLESTVWRRTP